MDGQISIAAIAIFFSIALIGFFVTKTEGYGRYSTAALLFILVLFITSLTFVAGKVETSSVMNLLAAVAGFAGGLFTAKDA